MHWPGANAQASADANNPLAAEKLHTLTLQPFKAVDDFIDASSIGFIVFRKCVAGEPHHMSFPDYHDFSSRLRPARHINKIGYE